MGGVRQEERHQAGWPMGRTGSGGAHTSPSRSARPLSAIVPTARLPGEGDPGDGLPLPFCVSPCLLCSGIWCLAGYASQSSWAL